MRKRLIAEVSHDRVHVDRAALDLANLAIVEITAEEEAHPIECALQDDVRRGWRAAQTGPQTIRLLFERPQTVKRICLVFEELNCSAHSRVRAAVVAGLRRLLPRNCSPAMEFQSARKRTRNGELCHGVARRDCS